MSSRYRPIHVSLWNDDKFPFMSREAQMVWLHLLTTPMSNQFGCYRAGVAALAEEMRWDLDEYRDALVECIACGLVKYDPTFRVVRILKYLKYNPPACPNALIGYATAFKDVPNCPAKYDALTEIKEWVGKASKHYKAVFKQYFNEFMDGDGGIHAAMYGRINTLIRNRNRNRNRIQEQEVNTYCSEPLAKNQNQNQNTQPEKPKPENPLPEKPQTDPTDAPVEVPTPDTEPAPQSEPEPETNPEPVTEPPADDPARGVYISLPTNKFTTTGELYHVTDEQVEAFAQTYPAVDVRQTLLRIRSWLNANPTKRKTKRGMPKCIDNWLAKDQDKARTFTPAAGGGQVVTGRFTAREAATMDNLQRWLANG